MKHNHRALSVLDKDYTKLISKLTSKLTTKLTSKS